MGEGRRRDGFPARRAQDLAELIDDVERGGVRPDYLPYGHARVPIPGRKKGTAMVESRKSGSAGSVPDMA
jgi:hypothetical protein